MNAQEPSVSALIPLYNGARTLPDTLESLRAQSLRDWEAIIIDDGSTDLGPDIAAAWARADRRIKLFSQPNAGVAAARNHALTLATGRFVHFLDCDDLLEPDAYRLLVEAACRAEGGAYGAFHVVNESGEQLVTQHRAEGRVGLPEVLAYPHLQTVAHIIRRAALQGLHFDGHYTPYEDQHLWLRLAERGHDWITVPQPVAGYRIRPGSLSKNCERALRGSQAVMREAFARVAALPDHRAALATPALLDQRLNAYALSYATRAVLLAHQSPTDAAAEGLRLLDLADGSRRFTLRDAARAGWWQAVYGLALRPDPDRDANAPWGDALRAFWRAAIDRDWLAPGDIDAAWDEVFVLVVDPSLIIDRLLARIPNAKGLSLVGFGQNGRALAATARARGLAVAARDDRAPTADLGLDAASLAIEGQRPDDPFRPDWPVILTPLDDAALLERFASLATLRWSDLHAEIIAQRRAARAARATAAAQD